MKTLRPLLFFVSLLLIAGLACGGTPTAQPIEQPAQLVEPTAPAPVAITEEPPTEAPTPTEAPAPDSGYFTEEFDSPLTSDWTPFIKLDSSRSDADKVEVEARDGRLVWDFDSEFVYYYLFYDKFEYQDVRLEVSADNRGKNNNNVSLICRYDPEVGWYEFNIANNGLYNIYFAEKLEKGENRIAYNRVANGGSNAIKMGKEINEYAIECQGDELTLYINGEKVNSLKEKKYALRSGQVGVSVSSFDVLPILVEMDWIKVSEP
jgi:hypothetical protein